MECSHPEITHPMHDLLHVVDSGKCHGITTAGHQCRINPRKGFSTCGRHEAAEPFVASCLAVEAAQRKRCAPLCSLYTATNRVRIRVKGVPYFLDVVTKRVYSSGSEDAPPLGRYVQQEVRRYT